MDEFIALSAWIFRVEWSCKVRRWAPRAPHSWPGLPDARIILVDGWIERVVLVVVSPQISQPQLQPSASYLTPLEKLGVLLEAALIVARPATAGLTAI